MLSNPYIINMSHIQNAYIISMSHRMSLNPYTINPLVTEYHLISISQHITSHRMPFNSYIPKCHTECHSIPTSSFYRCANRKLNIFSGSQKLLSRRSNFLLELPYFFTHLFNSNIECLPCTRSTSDTSVKRTETKLLHHGIHSKQ